MDSTALDVAIGVVLLYAVLSLFVTVVVEIVSGASPINMRGGVLSIAIKSAFGAAGPSDTSVDSKVQQFYETPIIAALFLNKRKPSEIAPEMFVQAFLSVVAEGYPANRPTTPAEFVLKLKASSKSGDKAVNALEALLPGAEQDWSAFETKVAKWFSEIGMRSEGWFKRRMSWTTLALSAAFACALNVDTLFVTRMLWLDSNLRKNAVELADRMVQKDHAPGTTASAQMPADIRQTTREDLEKHVATAIARINDALTKNAKLRTADYSTPNAVIPAQQCMTAHKNCKDNAKKEECFASEFKCTDPNEYKQCRQKALDCQQVSGQLIIINDKLVQVRSELWQAGKRTEVGSDLLAQEQALANTLLRAEETLSDVKYALANPYLTAKDTGSDLKPALKALNDAITVTGRLLDERFPSRSLFQTERICRKHAELTTAARHPDKTEGIETAPEYRVAYRYCQRLHAEASAGQMGIPLGWNDDLVALQLMPGGDWKSIGFMFLGWMMSALALSLGAPFWFDTLGRLVKLRSAGTRSADKETQPPSPQTYQPTQPGSPTSGTPAYFPDGLNALERSLKKDEIVRIQQALKIPVPSGRLDEATRQRILGWRTERQLSGYELTESMVAELLGYAPTGPNNVSPLAPPPALPGASQPQRLVRGSQGEAVSKLISLLVKRLDDFEHPAGTTFDDEVEKAVKRFQDQHNLGKDGEVGPETWLKLSHDPDELPAEMSTPPWMARAIGEIGQKAISGPGDNQRILEYLRACTDTPQPQGDDTPWCAAFLGWALARSGYALADDPAHANRSALLTASAWKDWGKETDACYGAITVIKPKGRELGQYGQGAHVGFLIRESGNDFIILGGNQENGQVSSTRFPKASYDLLAYRWPSSTATEPEVDEAEKTAVRWLPGAETRDMLDDPANPLISRGSPDRSSVLRLQLGLRNAGKKVDLDGIFGPQTEKALVGFQAANGLPETGETDPATWIKLAPPPTPAYGGVRAEPGRITSADITTAASKLNIDEASVKAVIRVESAGSGFIGSRPKILFEGHIFWRELKKRGVDPSTRDIGDYADVLYEKWTRRFYRRGDGEHDRLEKAEQCALQLGLTQPDAHDAACASASWGLFQILGNNYKACGFDSASKFAGSMATGESEQLKAFCNFVIADPPLHQALKEKRWADFARKYNGPAYAQNRYDQKLAEAYTRNQA